MISTLYHINETEVRIQNQLERFREKVNQGLDFINEMRQWFKTTDMNKLNINILSSYQVATNFLDELIEYHARLLHVQYNEGTLYNLSLPAHVLEAIEDANKKLPGHLKISPFPTVKMEIEYTEQTMQVFSSFVIIDITEYDLVRVTPTPLPRANRSFCIFDIPRNLLAVN
ncbi:unnamed protein product [Psylliodes chrysocephalus]|uniref:Uncharacterized protein n=1 Tax=Psylliodes chrysocephalus TaxID=3402493 RepID=A0A9P0CPK8_9CUCU|nr:unnamed protein product [Psylliodes chrysocephala]